MATLLFLPVLLITTLLVSVLVSQGHVSTESQQREWLTRESHVRASQLCSEVFSVSAPWFTPPADPIVTVMTVLTLPPASLSLSFSLSFRLFISFSYFMCLPSIPPSSRIDSTFNISVTSKMHSSKPSLLYMLYCISLSPFMCLPPFLCLHLSSILC